MSRGVARAVSAGFGVAMFVAVADSIGGPLVAAIAAGVAGALLTLDREPTPQDRSSEEK